MQNRKCCVVIAVFGICLLMAGCGSSPEKRFDLKGRVVLVNKARHQVTIAHEQIAGFMDSMTMPFNVHEDWALEALAPGQTVEATLVVKGDSSWIEGIRISQTEAGSIPETGVPILGIGEEVPDFTLVNQDGKQIRLAQYRGQPLLLTFIYTRCPLPDFCPRTSRNFSEVYRGLASISKPGLRPHLLTVSFDTEYDTPAILREYARRYMNPPDFAAWEFATGTPEAIKKMTGRFGLVYRKESGQIEHSLVTALIGSDGKLKRMFLGNQWTPGQVLAEFRWPPSV